jgi:hypothetical protein
VIHQGTLLDEMLALGFGVIIGNEIAEVFAGGWNDDALNVDKVGWTNTMEVTVVVTVSPLSSSEESGAVDGCTVTIIVVVTCVVLWPFVVDTAVDTDVEGIAEPESLLDDAAGVPGSGDSSGHARLIRGLCVMESRIPQSG